MGEFDSGIYSAAFFLFMLLIDRYVLRRGAVDLLSVSVGNDSKDYVKFELAFNSDQKFIKSELVYSVRDKEVPTTVIKGKDRTLDFTLQGLNREYLLIDKKLLTDGTWIVDVKVTTTGSRINPLHKIFPITTYIKQEVEIRL